MNKTVKGLDRLIKALDNLPDELREGLDAIVQVNASSIERGAKIRASRFTDTGRLSQSISIARSIDKDDISWSVVANADYAAFVEFGTGARVSVPAEMKQEAAKFRGRRTGSFQQGLDNIRRWCQAKGIDPKAAWPIFMAILRKGLKPQPFLYPAFVAGRKRFIKDLEDMTEDIVGKI